MDSIVIDIQKQVLSKSTTDVLRQAYIIARKLKIKDFEIWISNELNGYKEDDSIPEYRNIFGDIKRGKSKFFAKNTYVYCSKKIW